MFHPDRAGPLRSYREQDDSGEALGCSALFQATRGRRGQGQGCGRSGQSYDSDNFPTEARGSLAVPAVAAGRWLWQNGPSFSKAGPNNLTGYRKNQRFVLKRRHPKVFVEVVSIVVVFSCKKIPGGGGGGRRVERYFHNCSDAQTYPVPTLPAVLYISL